MQRTSIALLLACTGFMTQAHASDGTISFTGQVSTSTCTISVAGSGNNGSISLPPISTKALAASLATAGATPFSISLSGCTGSATQAAIWFENDANVTAAGRLVNSGTASNVDVAIYNTSSSTHIPIGQTSTTFGSSGTAFSISSGSATLHYLARYYANGQATAGTVSANVNYTVQYQ
ncbi:fimbrial protein [Aquitalea sp. USM4]|uniref:fimbrial protein n=1 Tax=Aquitalea sp. USM4 TaxID=1590041 RepID=UPI00103EC664|nr:fimbrial protein [Aquitalea sp. USM4]QBJ78988.1 type 1 fimbrial protein [Aquitalea sp. USM4]